MFCSKCGNSVKDDAVFCEKCGYKLDGSIPIVQEINNSQQTDRQPMQYTQPPQIIYVNQPRRDFISGNPEEVSKKMASVVFFIFSAFMLLSVLITLAVTRFGIIADLVESDYSHSSIERAFQKMYEESIGYIIIPLFAYIAYVIYQGFMLWKQCKKREFSKNRLTVKFNCVSDVICVLVLSGMSVYYLSDATNGDVRLSALAYVFVIAVIAFKIIYAVLYCQAADLEEYIMRKESHISSVPTSEWICVHCGAKNDKKDAFCQNCGKNYSRAGWICESCGTFNDKNAPHCKGCGTYK